MSCEQCIRYSRVDDRLTRPSLQNPSEQITALEGARQFYLVPDLPPPGGNENSDRQAMDVFPRYLFAYPTSSQDARTIAKAKNNIMIKHAYLPTIIISDKGSVFLSQVIKEVAEVLGITQQDTTTKHAQTIGMLERTHSSLMTTLKIETGEIRSMWHNYNNIAVLNYNTSYHTSIGCEPSRAFHERVPYNVLDIKMVIRPQRIPTPNSQIAEDVLKQTESFSTMFSRKPCKLISNTKGFMIKKTNVSKLKEQQYVYVLQPKADHRGSKIPVTDFRCIDPYIVEKALSNNNYLVQKLGTNKTQDLHCIRLRLFTPKQPIPDIQTTSQE